MRLPQNSTGVRQASRSCGNAPSRFLVSLSIPYSAKSSMDLGSERGRHPWQTSMTLDSTAALELGYEPVGNGIDLITEEIRWLLSRRSDR